jgi:hypothetical protein
VKQTQRVTKLLIKILIAIDVLHDHFKNPNALDEDDDNDIVFPTNITEYNIELNQDITEAEVLYAVKSLKKW